MKNKVIILFVAFSIILGIGDATNITAQTRERSSKNQKSSNVHKQQPELTVFPPIANIDRVSVVGNAERVSPTAEGNLTKEDYSVSGYYCLVNKDYACVIEKISKSIDSGGDLGDFNNRGVAYFYEGQYEKAIADFTKAINDFSNSPEQAPPLEVYQNRGFAYRQIGKQELAQADFKKVKEIQSKYENSIYPIKETTRSLKLKSPAYVLAYECLQKEQFDCAVENFNKAIELKSNDAYSYANRGFAYQSKKDFDQALSNYKVAAKLNPLIAEIYNNRATVYYQKGKYQNAVKDYSRAIKLAPDMSDAYSGRAQSYLMLDKDDLANADFARARDLVLPLEKKTIKKRKYKRHSN